MTLTCKRCGKGWESGVAEPRQCKLCKSPFWNKERVRAVGGGRKSGGVVVVDESYFKEGGLDKVFGKVKPDNLMKVLRSRQVAEVDSVKAGPHGLEDVKKVDLSFEYAMSSEPVAARSLLGDAAKTELDVKQEAGPRNRPMSNSPRYKNTGSAAKAPTASEMQRLARERRNG